VRKNPGLTMVVEMPKSATSALQGLHPPLEAELRGGVGADEIEAGGEPGRRGESR
jgi:hypothetical protein